MKNLLNYPFDSFEILKNKRAIKKELIVKPDLSKVKIAILSGSTIGEIKNILEIFLLNYGLEPDFLVGEFNRFYEDIMFENKILKEFQPDFIYIHTSSKNIINYPDINFTKDMSQNLLHETVKKFHDIWQKIETKYNCVVIQNNFELLDYRLLGNKDSSDHRGRLNFISQLNSELYNYSQKTNNFYINDINYLASWFGLEKWLEPLYWYMYKYCLNIEAIPFLCHNLANIIKSILGKNKKSIVLDLDNTLWGGVIGENGLEEIELGNETPKAQAYIEFQKYIKALNDLGVILNICSKNEMENAQKGFEHPDSILKVEDFISFVANWDAKHKNLIDIAHEINILPESIVFIDDNPAEREIASLNIKNISVPNLSTIENFIKEIDKSGFFEVTKLSNDDKNRHSFYKENEIRKSQQKDFKTYEEYLLSLEMKAEIAYFKPIYTERITQLINKTNQFNLTTKRYLKNDIEKIFLDDSFISLYGRLSDKFGDNGIVSLILGKIESENVLNIDLWVMSCRVFKRNLEFAMFDYLIAECKIKNINVIKGAYLKTDKNTFVADFYKELGFEKISEQNNGNSYWVYNINDDYQPKNTVIKVN